MAKIHGAHVPAEIKNLAINGNFDFWQRVEATTTTINTATAQNAYTADMWAYFSGGVATHNYSVAQTSTVPTESQSGFQSSLAYQFTRVTGLGSFAASDYTAPACFRLEGYDYAKIHGKTVTFGFWVQASAAGTYSFCVQNGAQTRNYVTTFTISGSNAWQFISITMAMEVPTTNYVFTNTLGIQILIGAVAGSTFTTATLNTWQAGQIYAATTGTNWMATNGATLQIAQFSIVEGPLGLGATGFARQGKTIQQEFALCQRYYQKSFPLGTKPATAVGSNVNSGQWIARYANIGAWAVSSQLSVPMRAQASFTSYNPVSANANWRDIDNNADITSFGGVGQVQWLGIYSAGNTATGQTAIHWTLDAGL